MTGEITLRGRVLPIGGLKEKLLAAKYAKIKEVLVPKSNKPDIKELDEEITDGLKITFVENMNEIQNVHHALHRRSAESYIHAQFPQLLQYPTRLLHKSVKQ